MSLLEDLLNENLTQKQIRVVVNDQFHVIKEQAMRESTSDRSKSIGSAKSLIEFYDLVRQAIEDYESRASVLPENKLKFTEEEPDEESQTETIAFNLMSREPGAWGRGAPMENKIKNLRPRLREVVKDPDNPGYLNMISGYWYDNVIRFTCWARTNKRANFRADWFESFMEEYQWWFVLQGVPRVLFMGRRQDIVLNIDKNKWYGRPIDFFVKTEKLRVLKEKTLEEIMIKLLVCKE